MPTKKLPPVKVSKSHGLTVVRRRKICLTLRKILRFECANKKIMNLNLFHSFFFMFHPFLMILSDIFALFLVRSYSEILGLNTFKISLKCPLLHVKKRS